MEQDVHLILRQVLAFSVPNACRCEVDSAAMRSHRTRINALSTPWLLFWGLLTLVGCESEGAKSCRENYLKAHSLINGADSKTIESAEKTLETVEQTLAICKQAKLPKEVAELEKAQRTLQSNVNQLRSQGSRKELSPEELDKLVKDGDPNCPKGQSYNYRKTGKQIKCTGPQVVAFSRSQAEEHFKNRGFRVKVEGTHLVAELGPESYHYDFSGSEANAKTQCLKVFAMPGMSWEESVSRVTGANPAFLKKGVAVKTDDGSKWPLAHIENEKQPVYTLGKCSP
jgi:hypothetical protein